MKILFTTLTTLMLATLATAPASAHHSAAQFDFRNTVVVEGKVMETRFANPHLKLIMEVTDTARGTRNIEFEGHSRNNMLRQGLQPDMFKVGDNIAIRIAPMTNGEDGGYVTAIRTPDGTEIGQVTSAD
ncbi:MAG: DUF6152 family protein [Pseudomonadota bacterium]